MGDCYECIGCYLNHSICLILMYATSILASIFKHVTIVPMLQVISISYSMGARDVVDL